MEMMDPFHHPFFTGDSTSMDLRASMTPAPPSFNTAFAPSAPVAAIPPAPAMEVAPKESGGRSLPFTVLFASSQDNDYQAHELNKGVQGRGWQSSRFCFYPQELILELQWPSRIINMQLLCHEYKIPSKVEVFVSVFKPWVHSEKSVAQMKRLGYLSLDPNERSGHQARELKSIHVDSPAAIVRLVLHNCYTNKLNVYNQVGLVALIITGDPLDPNQISSLLRTPTSSVGRNKKPSDGTMSAVDSFTATRIHRLQQEKTIAIQEEDYDEAKRLKALIEKLKGLGEQIKQLELQKLAAVEAEDFDAAKICKMEIEMLRKCDGVLAESLSCPTDGQECSLNTTEELWRSHGSSMHSSEGSRRDPFGEDSINLTKDSTRYLFTNSGEIVKIHQDRVFFREGNDRWTQTNQDSGRGSSRSPRAPHEQVQKGMASPAYQQDCANGLVEKRHDTSTSHFVEKRHDPSIDHSIEKRHDTSTIQLFENRQDTSISHSIGPIKRPEETFVLSQDIPIDSFKKDFHAPTKRIIPDTISVSAKQNVKHSFAIPDQAFPQLQTSSSTDELNGPEPLPDVVKAECGPLLNLIDLHHVQCLYSKQWQLRDKACQCVAKLLQSNGLGGDSSSFRILDSVLIRVLNDRVPNVFYSGLQLLKAYVVKYSSGIPARDLQHSSTGFVNILLEKLGDSNVRSKDAAAETLMFMASKKELGLDVVARPLLKPAKNQAIWKPILGRLNWLLVAIPTFGIQPQSRQGFSSEILMAYVSQAINSPNGEVRNAAVKVITEVYKLMGVVVERYLKGIKPMIREVLLNNFERVALETQNTKCPLTYDELENIPIPKRSRKPMYDIKKALDNDISISLEAQSATTTEFQPTQSVKKGHNAIKDGGLLSMVVEQQDRPTHFEDLQTMYSTEATALVENLTLSNGNQLHACGEEANAEKEILTEPRASLKYCEPEQSHQLNVGIEASFEPLICYNKDSHQDCIDHELPADKDELSSQCLFCGKEDSSFLVDDNLDLHFCQKCPMLVGCCNCKQIVEIASLKEHFLSECTSGRRYLECSKCSQAIPAMRMSVHVKSKECRHGKHHKTSRCPLCRHVVLPGDAGWRDHLLKPPGCPKNPRTISYL